ncbi:MAG: hypothetical protein JXA99_17725 [Candidatus Lokiarchaeota archaeon]|nr:hypothetical protein [Candidatus Lokiarchaeota archaeon]
MNKQKLKKFRFSIFLALLVFFPSIFIKFTDSTTTSNNLKSSAIIIGDTNEDGAVNIIDALLTGQYYVGLDPAGFNPALADVNGDGSVTIVDALLIAQYYVGVIDSFPVTQLKASDGTSLSSIDLEWSNFPDANVYEIYRAEDENGVYTNIGETTNNYYSDIQDIGLRFPGIKYYYKVNVITTNGEFETSIDSGYRSIPTPTLTYCTTNSPDYVTIILGDIVFWDHYVYQFYRATEIDGQYTLIHETDSISRYDDISAENGKKYYYKGRILSLYDNTIVSEFSEVKLGYRLLDSVPIQVSSMDYPDKIRVSWEGVQGAVLYHIERSSEQIEDLLYNRIGSVNATFIDFYFDDYLATQGVSWWYRVLAENEDGILSAWSTNLARPGMY